MIWRATIVLPALAAACTWGEPPAMTIRGVATDRPPVWGARVLLTVTGSGFAPDVEVDFDSPGRSSACAAVRAELRAPNRAPVPLRDARLLSPERIGAILDGDAGKETWDLVLIDAAGREATLPAALTVTGCTPPNAACDDGDECTYDAATDPADQCTGTSTCAGGLSRADDTPCHVACSTGASVAGLCRAGRCTPLPGACEPAPTCGTP